MCGYLGIAGNIGINEKIFFESFNLIEHRGPDESKIFSDKYIKLGFKRLKILDLSETGSQPMSSSDTSTTIVFNGEIYNYNNIRDKLKIAGIKFNGTSDTEVLLNFYLYLNRNIDSLLKNINGMFAFSLIDRKKKKIYHVRDRLGVKPLYFSYDNEKIVFSSEIKAIKNLVRNFKISQSAISAYLSIGFVPPWLSTYDQIQSVNPGEYIEWDLVKKNLNTKKYWSPKVNKSFQVSSLNEAKSLLKKELIEATNIRLNSDVPIGLFLSGGIDSGLVAAAVSKLGHKDIVAHTVRFKNTNNDESFLAQKTADLLGINLKIHEMDEITLHDIINAIKHFDEPFADPSLIVTDLICKKTLQNSATVVLTGDGGDESFCGYREYKKLINSNWINNFPDKFLNNFGKFISFIPNKKFKILSNRLQLSEIPRVMWSHIYPFDDNLNKLLNDNLKIEHKFNPNFIENFCLNTNHINQLCKAQIADLNCYLPNNVLKKTDMMSMKNSIELRSPFLDYKIVQLGLSLPTKYKIHSNKSKYILREIAKDWLPIEVALGKKRGFGVPLEKIFVKNENFSKDVIQQILKLKKYNYFNYQKLERYLLKKDFSSSNLRSIYKLFCLSVFFENK